eukprot:9763340-Alexandrium_andersonii.AAC.1
MHASALRPSCHVSLELLGLSGSETIKRVDEVRILVAHGGRCDARVCLGGRVIAVLSFKAGASSWLSGRRLCRQVGCTGFAQGESAVQLHRDVSPRSPRFADPQRS